MVGFSFIPAGESKADILSKHWFILRFGHVSKHYLSGWEMQEMTLKIEREIQFK
jgi:hypothetical protein